MALKEVYDSAEDVPEVHRELYAERGGKFVFNGLEGYVGSDGIKRLKDEAGGYRIKLKDTTSALDAWRSLKNADGTPFEKPEAVQAIIDEYPTLKAGSEAGGKGAEAVNARIEAAKKQAEAQFTTKLKTAEEGVAKASARINALENRERQSYVRDMVTKAINDSKIGKIRPEAIEDVIMYAERHLSVIEERDEAGNLVLKDVVTRDGVGVTPSIDVAAWLGEMQQRKGHWYEPSEGGGSGGFGRGGPSGGANPWAREGWSITAQGAYAKQYGMEKAAAMAKAAGSFIGAPNPPEPRKK